MSPTGQPLPSAALDAAIARVYWRGSHAGGWTLPDGTIIPASVSPSNSIEDFRTWVLPEIQRRGYEHEYYRQLGFLGAVAASAFDVNTLTGLLAITNAADYCCRAALIAAGETDIV